MGSPASRSSPQFPRNRGDLRALAGRGAPAIAAALLLCALAPACAGGPPPAISTNEAYARIQVAEAELEDARARLTAAAGEEARCVATDDVCRAAAAICEAARPIDEQDARARCARGQGICGALEACERP